MARRPTKLEFYEDLVTCPYCRSDIAITSLMKQIIEARRTCPICKRLMQIRDGRAFKAPGEGAKKSAERSHVSKTPRYGVSGSG